MSMSVGRAVKRFCVRTRVWLHDHTFLMGRRFYSNVKDCVGRGPPSDAKAGKTAVALWEHVPHAEHKDVLPCAVNFVDLVHRCDIDGTNATGIIFLCCDSMRNAEQAHCEQDYLH